MMPESDTSEGRGGRGGRGDKDKKGKDARKRGFARRKVCRFCADKNVAIDYKDPQTLKYFITDRGKIIPRRISGNCADAPAQGRHRHQARPHDRAHAVHRDRKVGRPCMQSFSKKTCTTSARPASW